ncbi:YegP family protein [Flavobacterium piscisymbiosum]|uniref:YegP family protein n=1 Tax=Flavobacterium piscisymbiosum TaxID=2893753 RepID=A0ABS8MGR5_9FLAO|nr:YegP family protein [Flavobacterium sp. F-30]MCC9064676.1 YegP family protein [Flavobacterium sp. F-30]
MEKFVINKNANGEYQFDFIDNNDEIILSSGEYTRKYMCIKGVESVKLNSQDNTKFNRKTSRTNKRYFNIKAFNGKIIAISKMFEDKLSCDLEIESFIAKAPNALIEDRTNNKKEPKIYSRAVAEVN